MSLQFTFSPTIILKRVQEARLAELKRGGDGHAITVAANLLKNPS